MENRRERKKGKENEVKRETYTVKKKIILKKKTRKIIIIEIHRV